MTTTDTITTVPAAAPKKGKGRKIAVIAGVGATLLIGVFIGKAGSGSTAAAAPAAPVAPVTVTADAPAPVTVQAPAPAPVTVTVTAPPAAAVAAPAAPVETGPLSEITKSGTFVVGKDIKAGKWVSDGKINPAKSVGYFAILNDPMGDKYDLDNLITNDNPEGQAFATLDDGQGFNTENLHWTLIG